MGDGAGLGDQDPHTNGAQGGQDDQPGTGLTLVSRNQAKPQLPSFP